VWSEAAGGRVVEVAGARYRIVPGRGSISREIHPEIGLVRVVTYRARPDAPPPG